MTSVDGRNAGDILIYTLSTCVWCKKTKAYLDELGVAYKYIDIDRLFGEERVNAENDLKRWNPSSSFPTMVFNGKDCIVGYKPSEILGALR